jgi:hypothetical protein
MRLYFPKGLACFSKQCVCVRAASNKPPGHKRKDSLSLPQPTSPNLSQPLPTSPNLSQPLPTSPNLSLPHARYRSFSISSCARECLGEIKVRCKIISWKGTRALRTYYRRQGDYPMLTAVGSSYYSILMGCRCCRCRCCCRPVYFISRFDASSNDHFSVHRQQIVRSEL